MGEVGLTMAILAVAAALCGVAQRFVLWASRPLARGKNEESRALGVGQRDDQINTRLWHLLHEDDPAWLVAMGIEKPQHIQEEEERQRREKKARATFDLNALKPLTPMAMGGNSFDRGVERQLESRLMGQNAATQQQMAQLSQRLQYMHQEQQQAEHCRRYRRGVLGSAMVDSMGIFGSL